MSANVPKNGSTRQLETLAEPDEQITPEQVKDAPRMARLLMSILRDVATLKRRWAPQRVDHEDRDIDDDTGATLFRFPHGFGARVRWWPVDWSGSGGEPVMLERHSSSDNNTLVLVSYAIGTVTLRIEEAG